MRIKNKKTQVYNAEANKFEETEWRKIRVGNIVKMVEDMYVPADMVFLQSTGPKGTCYVETKNLDGETNLKLK